MRKVLLARYGEVFLKGANRPHFLKILTDNVKKAVKPLERPRLALGRAHLCLRRGGHDECARRVRKVFGLYSVSPAIECEKDLDEIGRHCIEMMKDKRGSFKVFGKRSDKKFPMNSQELAAEIGGRVLESNDRLSVDIHNPQHKLHVEIRDMCYICCDELMAVGGLPMGTGGRAALLLSGGIDSPVAGYGLMKRGVRCCAIHFQSPPYTGELARDKVMQLARELAAYAGGMRVYLVPFTKCQLEIHEKCPDGLGTLITRRFMMRIAGGDRPQIRRAGADHRRKSGTGGLADDGGALLHGRGGEHARVPPAHRHGQDGDHGHRQKHRHLRNVDTAL